MAELSSKVKIKGYKGLNPNEYYQLMSVTEFRRSSFVKRPGDKKGVSSQALSYAMDKGHIDYIQVGPRVRIIVLTPKTKSYQFNKSPSRS